MDRQGDPPVRLLKKEYDKRAPPGRGVDGDGSQARAGEGVWEAFLLSIQHCCDLTALKK